jgi:hypothetical protein
MSKYQIGDLVLVKEDSDRTIYEIDGVMTKIVAGKMMTVYETKELDAAGICWRLTDDSITAKVFIQKPRAKYVRKPKENIEPELPLGSSIEIV